MSLNTENGSAQGQTTVLEKEGVYASLFEKINLTPASSLGDINAFLDDAALADASAGERLTAAMQVFMDCTLGKTAKEACSRVLVTLETADPDEAEGWLPGGVLHTDLLVLLRVYLGYRSDARLRLTVPVRLLPEPRLGKGRRIQLGRTGLLGLKSGKLSNNRETLTVSLGCYEGLQCSALPSAEDGIYRFDNHIFPLSLKEHLNGNSNPLVGADTYCL